MKRGLIKDLKWAYVRVSDNKIISMCYATTYFEAMSYFEQADLIDDPMYEVRIIHEQYYNETFKSEKVA